LVFVSAFFGSFFSLELELGSLLGELADLGFELEDPGLVEHPVILG